MRAENKISNPLSDRIFYTVNYTLLSIFLLLVLYPFIYVISCSFSSGDALMRGAVWLLPVKPSLDGYKAVFSYTPIWSGYLNSLVYMAAGTLLNVVMTIMAAYPLSRKDLMGRKGFMFYFMFTMLFNGGLIPNFLLISRLGLMNTRLAIILPAAMSAFNVIVTRTFFSQTIPQDLLESAKIDGCSDVRFLVRIVVPLSGPIIAVIALWVAVAFWNSYFSALIYLNDDKLYPLQIVLRNILIVTTQIDFSKTSVDPKLLQQSQYMAQVLKYGTIIVGSVPLMILYPFVQKYFVKGVMIGSLKG